MYILEQTYLVYYKVSRMLSHHIYATRKKEGVHMLYAITPFASFSALSSTAFSA